MPRAEPRAITSLKITTFHPTNNVNRLCYITRLPDEHKI
jgi:hypothetical protein